MDPRSAHMRLKGVCYDVGSVMGGNWRPDYNTKIVHRELEIIKNDLCCNAVNVTGQDLRRVVTTAKDALTQGLKVWLSPWLWNKSQNETLDYIVKAAAVAEKLRKEWPYQLTLSIGGELTLFMQGIVKGKDLIARIRNAMAATESERKKSNTLLNEFLDRANTEVRKSFHGQISYNSLIAEQIDWKKFDYIGVDHYWSDRIKDHYLEMLKPLFSTGKPVVITGFGFGTTSTSVKGIASSLGNVNRQLQFLHQLPLIGRFIRPRLNKISERDEPLQAKRLVDTLKLLDNAGVYGTFISTFIFPLNPFDDNPKYDFDRESESLVKYYGKGKYGTTYPDMMWEPKESFKAVAKFYSEK